MSNDTAARSKESDMPLGQQMEGRATSSGLVKQLSPLNRLAEIAEVVDLVLFLESAPFLNGEVIHLDGGAHAGKW
jgi:NAD(P)-dependent dehydrogenase (short-subunit alcohol dehydrogenase family)